MTIKKSKKKVITVSCLKVKQGKSDIYALKISAKTLWKIVQINARDPDKDQGYQRVLSPSRVRSIARYIDAGNCIPTSILIAFEKATVVDNGDFINLVIDDVPNSGWVIDGQHRLAGAHQATKDIELPVVAFVGLDIEEQIKQFITINKEAKGVPASLYYDLLSHLPIKSASERAKERAADIATELRNDEESPFFARIVITTTPIKGELSLNNFVRKVHPLVLDGRTLAPYSAPEQKAILSNYYKGLQVAFPSFFNKQSTVFFQTLGFGALINAFPTFFTLCLKQHKAFKVDDVAKVFGEIKHFDFTAWAKLGTGTAAENQAGEDLIGELQRAFENESGKTSLIDLV